MSANLATDFEFRSAYHEGLVLVGEAAGTPGLVRDAYRAAFVRGNPKHGLMILRDLLARTDQTAVQLRHFTALVLALAAEIEAAIPTPTQP